MTVGKDKKIAVIGAGLCGLTAAYRLQNAGFSVRVLEKSAGPGGRVQLVEKNGYLFDIGADAITNGYTEYIQLADELGIKDLIVPTNVEVATIRNGRLITFDASLISMAMTPLLSWSAKFRLLKASFALRKETGKLEIPKMYEMAHLDDPTMSAGALSKKIFGKEAADYLIDPMIKLWNGTNADRCSTMDVYLSLAAASHQPMAMKGGQAIFPRTIAKHLTVNYNTTVNTVIPQDDGGIKIDYQTPNGDQQQTIVDGCVIATMHDSAERIYPEVKNICSNVGNGIVKMALIKMQLAYRAPTQTAAYLVQVPDVEDPELYCLFLEHNKCPDRVPEGCSIVTVYTTNEATHQYLDNTDEELTEWARARVEKYMPELSGHFEFSLVSRWPYMAQASYPGYYRKAATDFPKVIDSGNIQLACDVFTKGGQNTAVVWGNQAARNLAQVLSERNDRSRSAMQSI